MRKGYFFLLGFSFVLALLLPGCGSTDPFVINSIKELKNGQKALMDEYDGLAEKHGENKLPQSYRDDKLGAFDDLEKYLKGERPKKEDK